MTVDRATELNHTCVMVHSSSRRYKDMDDCYYILIASLELRWHIETWHMWLLPRDHAPVAGQSHQLITWSAHGGSFRGSGAETAATV